MSKLRLWREPISQAFLKELPHPKAAGQPGQPPTIETTSWQGNWKDAGGGNYDLSLSSNGKQQSMPAMIDGTRLTVTDDKSVLVFDREE